MNGIAVPAAHAGADRLPAEIALAVVFGSVLIASVMAVIHRSLRRARRPGSLPDAGAGPGSAARLAEPAVAADSSDREKTAGPEGRVHRRPPPQPALMLAGLAAMVLVGALIAAVLVVHGRSPASQHASAVAAGGPAPGQPVYPLGPGGTGTPSPGASHGRTRRRGHRKGPSTAPRSPGAPASGRSGTAGGGARTGGGSGGSGGSIAAPSPAPAAAPPPSPGTLVDLPTQPQLVAVYQLTPSWIYLALVRFTAAGGPVNFTVSGAATADYTITADPASGTLQAGQQETDMVYINMQGGVTKLNGVATVTVNPGGYVVQMEIAGTAS